VCQEWCDAAEVRELPADVGVALERAAVDQVRHCAGGLERELVEPDRMLGQGLPVGRECRMHEHVRSAAVELGHQRLERGIAEIGAGDVGDEHHAVERQLVERMAQLVERGVDVGQRQARQRGEALRCAAHDRRQLLVDDARQLARLTLVAEEHTGRSGRDHRGVDPVTAHHLVERLDRDRVVRGRELRRQAGDVSGWQNVGVCVDPWHEGVA
jgi:hypothetical protein